MKTILKYEPAPTTGRRYWRSLDELADTPEFKDWLHREFPQGASEFTDDVSRRHFLKIMSASFAFAGLAPGGRGLPPSGGKTRTVRQQQPDLRLWQAGIFCDGDADAQRRDSARRQILRRPSDKDRGQRALSRRQRRHGPLRAGFHPESLRSRPRATFQAGWQNRFARRGVEISRRLVRKIFCELKAKVWRFSPKAARRRRARGCKKSSRRNFRNRNGSLTTRLIPASINARRRRRSASR
jgi:MoCo/4Fe-4S cofactor protein with predicted Tat translocation signal